MAYFTDAHLKAIAKEPHLLGHIVGKTKLTPLHSEWIKYCWTSKVNRSLQAHRGSYKTTAIAEVGAIVNLLFRPDERIGIIRKTFSQAAEVVKTISTMMKLPETRELFKAAHGFYPEAEVDREGRLTYNFKSTVTPEGSINAHGLDYGMTGKHYDRILLDDFITLRDRISKAERDKSKEVLREILTNIIDPGQPVSLIGTPWHKSDAWSICPTPLQYDVYKAGLLSTEEIKQKRETTTPLLFGANYELVHLNDDNALFQNPTFAPWDYTIKPSKAQLDAAFDGDHFCALTFLAKKPNGRIQGYGKVYPGNVKDWNDTIFLLYKKFNAGEIWIEENADKGYTADELQRRKLRVRRYDEHQNKHIKISNHLYYHWKNIDWDPSTEDEYLEQVTDYMEGQEPDDAPDSAASLLRQGFPHNDNSSLYEL